LLFSPDLIRLLEFLVNEMVNTFQLSI
jgi:hypothetical protein